MRHAFFIKWEISENVVAELFWPSILYRDVSKWTDFSLSSWPPCLSFNKFILSLLGRILYEKCVYEISYRLASKYRNRMIWSNCASRPRFNVQTIDFISRYKVPYLWCSSDHVLDEVPMSRCVDDGDEVLVGTEFPQSDVDGDTSFTFCLQFVQHPGVLEWTFAHLWYKRLC